MPGPEEILVGLAAGRLPIGMPNPADWHRMERERQAAEIKTSAPVGLRPAKRGARVSTAPRISRRNKKRRAEREQYRLIYPCGSNNPVIQATTNGTYASPVFYQQQIPGRIPFQPWRATTPLWEFQPSTLLKSYRNSTGAILSESDWQSTLSLTPYPEGFTAAITDNFYVPTQTGTGGASASQAYNEASGRWSALDAATLTMAKMKGRQYYSSNLRLDINIIGDDEIRHKCRLVVIQIMEDSHDVAANNFRLQDFFDVENNNWHRPGMKGGRLRTEMKAQDHHQELQYRVLQDRTFETGLPQNQSNEFSLTLSYRLGAQEHQLPAAANARYAFDTSAGRILWGLFYEPEDLGFQTGFNVAYGLPQYLDMRTASQDFGTTVDVGTAPIGASALYPKDLYSPESAPSFYGMWSHTYHDDN